MPRNRPRLNWKEITEGIASAAAALKPKDKVAQRAWKDISESRRTGKPHTWTAREVSTQAI